MTEDPDCFIDGSAEIDGVAATFPKALLTEFLTRPPPSDQLKYILNVFQRTTLERYPLFDTLARIACETTFQ